MNSTDTFNFNHPILTRPKLKKLDQTKNDETHRMLLTLTIQYWLSQKWRNLAKGKWWNSLGTFNFNHLVLIGPTLMKHDHAKSHKGWLGQIL